MTGTTSSSTKMDIPEEKWTSRPERHRPFTPFEAKEQAEEFIRYLADNAGIRAEIVWTRGNLNPGAHTAATSFWDLKVPYKDVFKVKLLYRIKDKYLLKDIPSLSKSEKKAILRDFLHGEAHLKGGWREPACPLSQLEWYSRVSRLPVAAAKKAVAEAKTAYNRQHASGKVIGYRLGGVMILAGILIFSYWDQWRPAPVYGFFCICSGMAFLVLAMTRRNRPQYKKRIRLPD